jgi:LytR cell envelope-related transcriptional attenuator
MGRHSTGDQTSFYRSAALWFVPWAVGGVVAIAALWIAVDALGNVNLPDLPSDIKKEQDKGPGAAAAKSSPSPSPTASPSSSPSPSPKESSAPDKKPKEAKLVTEGVSLQVLNGTTSDEVDDAIADQLEVLGFEVVAVNPYPPTPNSIVYWSSPEAQAAGEALAERLEWKSAFKPSELSSEVDLHVYIGEDEL